MRHVALLIDTSSSYGRGLLRGVRKYVSEHDPWSMYLDLRSLDSKPPSWLKSWSGDGLLVRTGNRLVAEAVAAAGLPTVEMRTSRFITDSASPFVGVDNAAIGTMVTEHFLDRGFRHFAVYGTSSEEAYEERRENFMQAVERAGFHCEAYQHPSKHDRHSDWEKEQQHVADWAAGLKKPVAVLACTDQLGFWFLDACKRAGVAVPEEIAVVGCENDECLAAMSSPPMSSVQFQTDRIGYEAAEILERLMSGDPPPEKPILVPPLGIEKRQSSDIVAVEDQELASALLFIRENSHRNISVEDVLQAIPMSRATLDQRMRATIGRTAKAEIVRVQLETVKRLLAETDLSLAQIADKAGFRHPQYMAELFKKKFGITPGTYRGEVQKA